MHFNDLIMRLRTQAVGGLAGVVAISGFAVNFTQKPGSDAPWIIFFGTLVFFLIAWGALWILDRWYYDQLLIGAVDAILELENKTLQSQHEINLSSKIRAKVPNHQKTVNAFYGLVALPLFLGVLYTGYEAFSSKPKGSASSPVEYKIQLHTPDTLKVAPEPAKIEHKVEVSVPGAVKVIPEPAKVEQQIQLRIPDGVKVISEPTKAN